MRIALEVVAVLERAGLAFVDVDRHQPRRGLGAHDPPLAARRKAGAAQAAQPRISRASAITDSTSRSPRDAGRRACGSRRARGTRRSRRAAGRSRLDVFACGDRAIALRRSRDRPDCGRRPRPARARSGRCTARRSRARRRPHARRSASRSASAPAIWQDSVSQTRTVIGGRGRLAFLHDVEVMVERRDLVDLGESRASSPARARRDAPAEMQP